MSDDDEFYPVDKEGRDKYGWTKEDIAELHKNDEPEPPAKEEPEPSHVCEVPDDSLTEEQILQLTKPEPEGGTYVPLPPGLTEPLADKMEKEWQPDTYEKQPDGTLVPEWAGQGPFGPATPGEQIDAVTEETVLDLDHLPESGEERLKLAVEMLKTTYQIVDELEGDFDPAAVRAYTDQLKSMLDDAVTLYNILVGKWALAKVYAVGELVYFDYFNMTHIGKIKTIAKSELLIEFDHTPKNRPGSEARHVETWRRKDQVRKP